MVTHICSFAISGIDIVDVDVQAQISSGMPKFNIVGLADKTIAESKERISAALKSMGLSLPSKKILCNLAPADLVKEGSHFDLPIALTLLSFMEIIPIEEISNYMVGGELSLDGSILQISGILPASIGANARGKGLICPKANGSEAAFSGNKDILAPAHLLDLANHFKGIKILKPPEAKINIEEPIYDDMADIQGQETPKRVMEIAAAGGHNMLMSGPPGSGKSMIAHSMPGILPKMTAEEILECSTLASIAGIGDLKMTNVRPFRSPHHTISKAALVGGGNNRNIKPGEISLAHNGILFLDELPEFPSNVIESLRSPIESGQVLIARSGHHITYPCRFQLLAAMNPCKCGYLDDSSKSCSRAPKCGLDYQNKISGPIMDRFDLFISVPRVEYYFGQKNNNEKSETIRKRVENARERQLQRYEGYNINTNARLGGNLLIDYAMPVDGSIDLLNRASEKFKFSMRAYNRILRVARTIADLDESNSVQKIHLAEALNYRNLGYGKSV